ncbi:MAG TPA: TIGR04283 family arsenosugar biosynthesis glycosyltransferase [Casimicrobiaceae bacterium]|nr:TIGR04283 family arsenosugar biosynthesis glycosyltransferase [Casimicrobiaceae bacterium]
MRVSIVVPALEEARHILAALLPLQPLRGEGHEVIVVDGGSRDATVALATPLADRVIVAGRGRALQMNAGAAIAAGDFVLFLHADTQLAASSIAVLEGEIARTQRRWGRFDVAIAGRSRVLPIVAAMMNARSSATGIATGDQAIFVERALFAALGGFTDQALMEDIELSTRLKRAGGPPLCLSERVVTSGRRWEHGGAWRTIARMWLWRLAYWRGADPAELAAEYGATQPSVPVILQVFAKSPVPGGVKTRLAAAIGPDAAAAHQARFVEMTMTTAVAARDAGVVDEIELWCSPDTDAPGFAAWRNHDAISLHDQDGGDLGAKMRTALDSALARGARAILVGTDCPLLDVRYLARAVAALETCDAVFGPAEDGGYVLVGLSRSVDAFAGVPWSSPDTMAATRARLAAAGAAWQELPTLWDVDEARDLARWQSVQVERARAAAASS